MLTRERPDFRTVDRWAVRILLGAGAIHECDQHGWAKQREMLMPISEKGEGKPKSAAKETKRSSRQRKSG
jgi:hypothetical protein